MPIRRLFIQCKATAVLLILRYNNNWCDNDFAGKEDIALIQFSNILQPDDKANTRRQNQQNFRKPVEI